jgi:hypothetical protein
MLAVSYWDVHNYSEEPRSWDYGDWHHAVMGVELVTDRGPSSIVWSNTFYPCGVGVFPEPISNHVRLGPHGCEGWPVEAHGHWRSRLGSPILTTDTFWERIDLGPARRNSDNAIVGPAETYMVPVAFRFDFEAGPVWMVAGMPSWPDVENVSVPADETMVVFSPNRIAQDRLSRRRLPALGIGSLAGLRAVDRRRRRARRSARAGSRNGPPCGLPARGRLEAGLRASALRNCYWLRIKVLSTPGMAQPAKSMALRVLVFPVLAAARSTSWARTSW